MKIVVDIGHPAHVHVFKYFIKEMKKRGYKVMVTMREREEAERLLKNYKIPYTKLGRLPKSTATKMIGIPWYDIKMYLAVRKFNPDVFVSHGSYRAAQVSRLMGKFCITTDDSEPCPREHMLYLPFTDVVITPEKFKKDFGKKQIRIKSYKELAYLHPNKFKPNPYVLKTLGISKNERYVLLRFNSFDANHDIGIHGLTLDDKRRLVKELEKYARVFITSELKLPDNLKKYGIRIPPEKLHDVLYYATLLVGDTQTMTAEAACLGVPAIRCNSFVGPNDMSNFIELEKKYGLIFNFRDKNKAIKKAIELIRKRDLKKQWKIKRKKLLKDKIDLTEWMIKFVINLEPNRFLSK